MDADEDGEFLDEEEAEGEGDEAEEDGAIPSLARHTLVSNQVRARAGCALAHFLARTEIPRDKAAWACGGGVHLALFPLRFVPSNRTRERQVRGRVSVVAAGWRT